MAIVYSLYLEPEAHASRRELPGHIRQQIRARIAELANIPRPSDSRILQIQPHAVSAPIEIRRLRLGSWRVVYAIHAELIDRLA